MLLWSASPNWVASTMRLHIFRLPRLKLGGTSHPLATLCLCLLGIFHAYAQPENDYEVRPDTYYDNELLCRGEWKYPPDCSNFTCDYKASWEYRDEDDQIVFTISTKNRNKWTGIGFSEDQKMPNTDAILGLVEESGRFFLMDSWLQAYEAPPLDQYQNLYNQTAWRENGITTLRFSRPRQTGDSKDYQFSDTNCPYFIFPVMGGVFNAVNKRIRKHESVPVFSDRQICIRSCRAPTTTTSTSTTTSTTTTVAPTTISTDSTEVHAHNESDMAADEATKIYRLELKLSNFLTAQTKQVNSEEYQNLLSELEGGLYGEIKPHFDRVRRVEVNEVISEDSAKSGLTSTGNVLAIVELTIGQKTKEDKDETQALTIALNSVIQDRRIDRFTVDPSYLVIARKDGKLSSWIGNTFSSFSRFTEDEQKWIIIGAGISALVLLAITQALCMFCRCKSSDSRQQEDYLDEKDNVDKQWKEYTHEQYNGVLYNGYGMDEYGYGNGGGTSKSNSLHKNYRAGHGQDRSMQYQEYNHGGAPYHPSLDRRQYEQQQQQQHTHQSRRSNHGPYEMNDRQAGGKYGHGQPQQQQYGHQMQPDFYFMPHQRKYSSDVVRVFVDYDNN